MTRINRRTHCAYVPEPDSFPMAALELLFSLPGKLFGYIGIFALLLAFESIPGVFAYCETAKPAAIKQVHDTDHVSKQKTKIVNHSNGEISVTFTNCRLNEKQHVSCQFTSIDGKSHWVYLPGVTLPASK